MRKKLVAPLIAMCLLMSFPVQAAKFCPYHWYLGIVAALSIGETLIASNPAYRLPVRAAEGAVVLGVAGYIVKATIDAQKSDPSPEKSPAPEQASKEG